ncbi:MAG: CHRD domain-containing protein [Chloroflexota bacterium]|nr:CHRD domain-containing protein [Chloroflexota bacterium]
MRKLIPLALVLIALLAVVSTASAGGRPFSTSLSGAEEFNPVTGTLGAGDPDASGFARITLNQGQGEICIEATVSNTSSLVGAHIHAAPAGSNGPVVVNFSSLIAGNTISGCVSVDSDLVKAIRQNPQGYYINVHSTEYPAGAVRGQLGD